MYDIFKGYLRPCHSVVRLTKLILCSRYVLGVYDKKTEVMKMYDTEMITLQPQILGNDLMKSLCSICF